MRKILLSAMAVMLIAGAGVSPAVAVPCKDAKGKFVKCPPKVPQPVRCKDAKGKFVKCGMPGAKPIK